VNYFYPSIANQSEQAIVVMLGFSLIVDSELLLSNHQPTALFVANQSQHAFVFNAGFCLILDSEKL
jgi:hypothetical protein